MRRTVAIALAGLLSIASWAGAQTAPAPQKPVREIFIPFKDLDAILEKQPQRVLLKREEFLELQAKAKKAAETHAPIATATVAADYSAVVGVQRALITATLTLDCLEKGVQAVPLDLRGLSITRAFLDGTDAPIGVANAADSASPLLLFVNGVGRHELKLEMVSPVETTASQQILRFRLPKAPAAQLGLTAPGDVEIRSGAQIIRREVDANAKVTRFEILPRDGDQAIAMTLNSHLQRQERAVVANTVALSEVTQAYEKLHAAVSLQILYKAVDRFRFAVPEGFEVLEVSTPLLARWEVVEDNKAKILVVQLREQTTEPVAINIAAIRTPAVLQKWTAPQLKPLDVAGHVAVVGLLVEDRLRSESIAAKDLISIDVMALRNSMPESVLKAAPGAPALRPVAAWYAPDGGGSLSANFARPSAGLAVTTNLVLRLTEQGQEIDGALAVLPEVEKRFSLGFSVPALWHVDRVAGPNGQSLPFERYGDANKPGRIEVRLPAGIPADQEYQLRFHAMYAPEGWLSRWEKFAVPFPVFSISGATRDEGALAVAADEDMDVRPEKTEQLTPLLEPEKPHYGLSGVATKLAWRYEVPGYQAAVVVTRPEPRITARTFAFFQVKPDVLGVHYELVYQVDEARSRELAFVLPISTPKAISIRTLDGVRQKEPKPEDDKDLRRWTVPLEDARRGRIRLAVDFDQTASEATGKPIELPMIAAEGVAYQSGLAAVEGSAELNVQVKTEARQVDVGELVEADYQPGRRLLGAYGFVGEPPAVRVAVDRTPAYALYPALVERAALDTYLAAEGVSQTEANFTLKTKALLLELELPKGASLWSATLDGQPIKPQKEGDSLLISFPAANAPVARHLQFVYDARVQSVTFSGEVEVPAPKLLLRAASGAPSEKVPLGDLVWRLHLPTGYKVTRCLGSVTTTQLERPVPAAVGVAEFLYHLAGGVNPFYGATHAATKVAYVASSEVRGGREYGPAAARCPTVYDPAIVEDKCYPDKAGQIGKAKIQGEKTKELLERFDSLMGEAEKRQALDQRGDRFSFGVGVTSEAGVVGPIVLDEANMKHDGGSNYPATLKDESGRNRENVIEQETEAALDSLKVRKRLEDREKKFGDLVKRTDRASIPMGSPGKNAPAETPPAPAEPAPEASLAAVDARFDVNGGWFYRWERASSRSSHLGMRSLKIELAHTPSEQAIDLRSLGEEPRLIVGLARSAHVRWLGAGLSMLTLLWGLAITRTPVRRKVRYVLTVLLLATLVPFLWLSIEVADVANAVFYAATALVPYYLLAGMVGWFVRSVAELFTIKTKSVAAVLLLIAVAGLCLQTRVSAAEPPKPGAEKYIVQVIEPSQPIQVPDDAVVIPFDPTAEEGTPKADRLLVPYPKFVELWNQAYPDRKIDEKPAPAPYALSGAAYRATLSGDDYLLLTGTLSFDVFTEEFIQVPLRLAGGVLARAELDGKPARLQMLEAQPLVAQGAQQSAKSASVSSPTAPLVMLHLSGKGRHKLELSVRMKIARQGGWRSIDGALPTAAAAALDINVPEAQTEVRLGQVADRRSYDTEKASEEIRTALGTAGRLSIQWRPKVAEGQVDQALTSQSNAILNVEEDGLRLVWRVALDFRRSQRERFTVMAPKDCLIERVEGPNVRGWTLKDSQKRQTIEVELLKAAKDREEFTVTVWRAGKVGAGDLAEFDIPVIEISDAALSSGEVTVCRSPLLDLRAVEAKGASRVDLADVAVRQAAEAAATRPLGVRPFQAYRFATMPFTLRMAAQAKTLDLSATVQSVMKIADIGNTLLTHIQLDPKGRPVHEVQILLPAEFALDNVFTPGEFQWAVTHRDQRPLLTVYLAAGRQQSQRQTAITLRGRLAKGASANETPLPQIEVLGAARQDGALAVQIDPAYDVEAVNLTKCERVLLSRLHGWLQESQRAVTRFGIEYREPGYSGTLKLMVRKPEVSCDTVTNVRFTPTAVKETIVLYYQIQNAGIRGVSFTLPPSAAGAGISAKMLRQKKPLPQADGSVRWTLDFQEEVMGELRVLVQNDRALVRGAECRVPLVTVHDAKTNRSYIALESAGRDEVEPTGLPEGMELLGRQTKEWQALQARLGGGNITQAWLVRDAAAKPLVFRTREREPVKTSGARILLAEAEIVVDTAGAYRAQQIYRINNTTEQYLEVQLPQDAELWTARVAAEPVKPKQAPGDNRSVRIPLVKTAVGELDYEVVLRYGGKMPELLAVARVDFPLMRTRGIQPERSLLSLYLPKSHQWLRFDGTMHEVFDVAEFDNEQIVYWNKQAKSALEASRQGDINTQIRAANSLKLVGSNTYTGATSVSAGNLTLKGNLSANAALKQQADAEVRKLEESLHKTVEVDNRKRLNTEFEGQQLARARNVVQNVGDNWDMSDQPAPDGAQAKAGDVQFNERWLAANGFTMPVNDPNDATKAASPPRSGGKDGKDAKNTKEALVAKGDKAGGEKYQPVPQGQVKWSENGKGKDGKGKSGGKPNSPQIVQQEVAQPKAPSSPFSADLDVPFQQAQKYYDRVQRQQADQDAQQAWVNNNLNKSGSGTLTLSGGNAYTGNTTVNNGTLVLQGQNTYAAAEGPQPANPNGGTMGRPPIPNQPPITNAPAKPNLPPSGQTTAPPPAPPGMSAPGVFAADLNVPFSQNSSSVAVPQMGGYDASDGRGRVMQAPATGLASLEIDLPVRDGIYEVHRFVTPRGEVELRAYAASRDRMASLISISAVLAVVLAGWGIFRLTRRGAQWITGPYGSTVLLVLGVASLCTGVLPVAGLAAALTGLVIKVRRALAQQVIVAEVVAK